MGGALERVQIFVLAEGLKIEFTLSGIVEVHDSVTDDWVEILHMIQLYPIS